MTGSAKLSLHTLQLPSQDSLAALRKCSPSAFYAALWYFG